MDLKDRALDEETRKLINKSILLFGPQGVIDVCLGRSGDEKCYAYIIKTSDNSSILHIPNNVKVASSSLLNEILKTLKGTLTVRGCENLYNANGLFRNCKQLTEIDMKTYVTLNNLTELDNMFYGVTANTVLLGDLQEHARINMVCIFCDSKINELNLGKIKPTEYIDLNEAFSFSGINKINAAELDTTNCIVNIRHMFKMSNIKYAKLDKLSVKHSIENIDFLKEGNIYLPFLNCDIEKEFRCNCEHLIEFYNRR